MNIKNIKYELQHLISGESGASYDALIQTTARYLRSGKRASPMAEEKHQNKTQEAERLIQFARQNKLLIEDINSEDFVSAGAEQKVYISEGKYPTKSYNLFLGCFFFRLSALKK